MNCENCPFRNTAFCNITYFNGLPVCTAYFNGKDWTTTNNVLGRQSGDTANTPENCQNSIRPLSADEFIGFVRNMYAINDRQAYIKVSDKRFEIDRVLYDTDNNIVVEGR